MGHISMSSMSIVYDLGLGRVATTIKMVHCTYSNSTHWDSIEYDYIYIYMSKSKSIIKLSITISISVLVY